MLSVILLVGALYVCNWQQILMFFCQVLKFSIIVLMAGAPVIISLPHFLNAEPRFSEAITGKKKKKSF